MSAEALEFPVQALIHVEGNIDSDDDLVTHSVQAQVNRTYTTIEGHQVYEIVATTLAYAADALTFVKAHTCVTRATMTLLYPDGNHRI